jgi:phosphoenolpyruvate carboxykinase (ATP)
MEYLFYFIYDREDGYIVKEPIQLSVSQLVEKAVERKEGVLASNGALVTETGKYTGRSPKDKFIVDEASVHPHIAWGKVNQAIQPQHFDQLYLKVQEYLNGKESFVFKGFAGADERYRLPIQVVSEYAWHSLFAHQLFLRPTEQELEDFEPEFTVIDVPGLKADPLEDGTNSETFIVVSFEKRLVLIGGTEYAGEIKKSIFSVMNYLMPQKNVFPMHCSANVGENGEVALFFGLSGTGKTTLSADPKRQLIGDDEHGWSDRGVFNFEGGCYAKCINLSKENEPQIWEAIRYGTVLENVVLDPETKVPNYDANTLTENTRAAYPLDYIPNAMIPSTAGHPNVVVFLTADAFGVLPPISKLTKEQAMYHFLSGYTSKLAGTERGVTEPEATFSTCFGAPFLPLRPHVYAGMLGEKMDQHQTQVYLVNTGWTGGAYGTGQRMKLAYTRAMVTAALEGKLTDVAYEADPIFGLSIPTECPGVPAEVLNPKNTWKDAAAYDQQAQHLAGLFVDNFHKFEGVEEKVIAAGPKVVAEKLG